MADDPKAPDNPVAPPTPPKAAADQPAGSGPAEPLKAEVSRTDAPGASVRDTSPLSGSAGAELAGLSAAASGGVGGFWS